MNLAWHWMILAADAPADYSAMGDHFRPENAAVNVPHLIVLALVVLVISSLIWALSRWQEDDEGRKLESPQRLFHDLCKLHDIGSNEAHLLKRISRELQLAHPASLFVDPSLLISAAQLDKFRESDKQVRSIGETLFGYHLWRQAVAADRGKSQDSIINS